MPNVANGACTRDPRTPSETTDNSPLPRHPDQQGEHMLLNFFLISGDSSQERFVSSPPYCAISASASGPVDTVQFLPVP